MPAEAKDRSEPKKYFDVAKPGKTMPDATSRPAIVGHRTILKDPMMASSDTPDEKPLPSPADRAKLTAPTLAPSKEMVAADKEVKETAVKPAEESESHTVPVTKTAPAEKPTAASAPAEATAEAPKASTDDEAPDPDKQDMTLSSEEQKKIEKEQEEAAAKQEALEKLVVDKTYFVPIGEKKRQRSFHKALLVGLLVFLLLAALGNMLIDAGIVKTSFKAPISVLNNE